MEGKVLVWLVWRLFLTPAVPVKASMNITNVKKYKNINIYIFVVFFPVYWYFVIFKKTEC